MSHTHIPRVVRLRSVKTTINPGSVGLPDYTNNYPEMHKMESLNPFTKYCALRIKENQLKSVNFFNVNYSFNKTAKEARGTGINDWVNWLATGKG